MHHLFLSYQNNATAFRKERDVLESWCRSEGVEYTIITENLIQRVSQHQIDKLLRSVSSGDVVVATSLTRLGRGVKMLMMVLQTIYAKGAEVFCIDTGFVSRSVLEAIEFVEKIERNIHCERSLEGQMKAREEGKQPGRPTGSRKAPQKSVLFGKTEEIDRMISQGIPITQIAKNLGVGRGTIYLYLSSKKHGKDPSLESK